MERAGNASETLKVLYGYPFEGQIRKVCPSCSEEWAMAVDGKKLPKLFFECSLKGACEGGPDYLCTDGRRDQWLGARTGRLCQACDEGWSSMFGTCFECQDSWLDWLIGFGGTACVLLVWKLLNAVAATEFDAVTNACMHVCVNARMHSMIRFGMCAFFQLDIALGFTQVISSYGLHSHTLYSHGLYSYNYIGHNYSDHNYLGHNHVFRS